MHGRQTPWTKPRYREGREGMSTRTDEESLDRGRQKRPRGKDSCAERSVNDASGTAARRAGKPKVGHGLGRSWPGEGHTAGLGFPLTQGGP
jgi:hypothetical protein